MRYLIHPSVITDAIQKTPHVLRITRSATGGGFTQFRTPAVPGQPAATYWDVSEALEWCRRCIRPWSEDQERKILASAKPESHYGIGGTRA